MISKVRRDCAIHWAGTHWIARYSAMAGPCEILIRCKSKSEADKLASLAFIETKRIERKFSRYRNDNIIYQINNSNGKSIKADEELARLLDYADQCYKLSNGLFDITSGILRKAWEFKGEAFNPDTELIESLLDNIGWDKVDWNGTALRLLPGMEIDLGGIGKEYAVDMVAEMLFRESGSSLMVNFGGDIRGITSESTPEPWTVGIEDPEIEGGAVGQIELINGGIATSGDLRRYCYVNNVRMGHILNPITGWPVQDAPRSVTVIGNYSVEAGILATLAMLHGSDAERFLKEQNVPGHCIR